jgi:hypothetical protein
MDRTSGIITEYIMTAHGTDWLLDLEVAMVEEEIRFWARGEKAVSVADVKEMIIGKEGKE